MDGKDTTSIGISCIAIASLLSFADLVSFYPLTLGSAAKGRQLVAGSWHYLWTRYTGGRLFLFKQTHSFEKIRLFSKLFSWSMILQITENHLTVCLFCFSFCRHCFFQSISVVLIETFSLLCFEQVSPSFWLHSQFQWTPLPILSTLSLFLWTFQLIVHCFFF